MQFNAAAKPAGFPGFAEPAEPVEQRAEFPVRRPEFPLGRSKFALWWPEFSVGRTTGSAKFDPVPAVVRYSVPAVVRHPVSTVVRYPVSFVGDSVSVRGNSLTAWFAGSERPVGIGLAARFD